MGHLCGNLGRYVNEEVFGNNSYDCRINLHGFKINHEEIGTGLFSKIKRATYKDRKIAVKIMDRDKMPEEFKEKYISREIKILRKIHHRNIVKIYKIFDYFPRVYIFMELINGDTLQRHLQEKGRMEEEEARFFFRQLVSAIDYLHAKEIAHRDLKPENIMIHNETIVKIIDFGFAIKLGSSDDMSLLIWGHSSYTAPEVTSSVYDPLAYDIWSLGAILFNMVTGTTPFSYFNSGKLLEEQMSKSICYPIDIRMSDTLVDILSEMLEPEITKRATIDQINTSTWLNNVDPLSSSESEESKSGQERLL